MLGFKNNRLRLSVHHRIEKGCSFSGLWVTSQKSDNLLVEGHFSGDVRLGEEGSLIIGSGGSVTIENTLTVNQLILKGGTLKAKHISARHLILSNNAVICSDTTIEVESMEIEAGCVLNGQVSVRLNAKQAPSADKAPSTAQIAKERLTAV